MDVAGKIVYARNAEILTATLQSVGKIRQSLLVYRASLILINPDLQTRWFLMDKSYQSSQENWVTLKSTLKHYNIVQTVDSLLFVETESTSFIQLWPGGINRLDLELDSLGHLTQTHMPFEKLDLMFEYIEISRKELD